MNVVAALILVIIAAPVALVIAILVKLTSRGPILYWQTRVGLDQRHTGMRRNAPRRREDLGGIPFTMYKFRTMDVDAEQGTGPVWAAKDDPRVTPIGRLLRQCRLNELPQVILELGVSPDLTQAAYRVGDSSTNIITPLMPYFPLFVAFCQRYVKSSGIGTLVAMMLPYSIALLVLWTAFLTGFWALGIPLGLGASYTYP